MALRRATSALTGAVGIGAAALMAAPAVAQTTEAETEARGAVELVLDSSGSMAEDDADGESRIDAARTALTGLISELPPGAPVGLRVYGDAHTRADKRASCDETTLVQEVSPLDPGELSGKVDDFTPGGNTPIGLALKDAAGDLPPDGEQVIVLVSDGIDTCAPPDPCKVAAGLANRGIDLRVQAIGFNVSGKAREALKCIAEATGGLYRDAADADSLGESLRAATLRALRGYASAGEPVTGGLSQIDAAPLDEGQYLDEIAPDEARWYAIELQQGAGVAVSATVVPPYRRFEPGIASVGGRASATLYRAEPETADETTDTGTTGTLTEPGEELDSAFEVSLLRELASGQPVSLLTSSRGLAEGEETLYFTVSLENVVEDLPAGNYPLELLVDRVGTPVAAEEEEPSDTAPDPGEESGDTPVVLAAAIGVAAAALAFAAAGALARRRSA